MKRYFFFLSSLTEPIALELKPLFESKKQVFATEHKKKFKERGQVMGLTNQLYLETLSIGESSSLIGNIIMMIFFIVALCKGWLPTFGIPILPLIFLSFASGLVLFSII